MRERYCYKCMAPVGPAAAFCPQCGFGIGQHAAEAHQLQPETLLRDRYYVGKVLGEGGFGITYVGKDTVLERKVAIKEFYMSGYVNRNSTVSSEVLASAGSHGDIFAKNREKFLLEARTLAKFDDEPGIVGIRDFFQENNTAYIVMDFLDGVNLREYVKKVGRISGEQLIKILEPVFKSLANVHKQNLIHRDISPDNIMLTREGRVKLLDFGAAREVSQDDIKSLSIILKPGYAPEEQYRSKGHQGPWTDVYALCATMYRCITGVVPDDAMERLFDDKLVPPTRMECDCSPAMSAVIMKGLRVRQADRYQSIPELWAALTGQNPVPQEAPPIPTPIPTPAPRPAPSHIPEEEDESERRTMGYMPQSQPQPVQPVQPAQPAQPAQPERQPAATPEPQSVSRQPSPMPQAPRINVSRQQAGIARFWQRWFSEICRWQNAGSCQIWFGGEIVPQVRANAAVYIAEQRVTPEDIVGILATEQPWGSGGIVVTSGYLYLRVHLMKNGLLGRSTSVQTLALPYRQLLSAKARGNRITVRTRDGRQQEAQLPENYDAEALARALNEVGGFLRSGTAYSG